jgi:hypothetical protein
LPQRFEYRASSIDEWINDLGTSHRDIFAKLRRVFFLCLIKLGDSTTHFDAVMLSNGHSERINSQLTLAMNLATQKLNENLLGFMAVLKEFADYNRP